MAKHKIDNDWWQIGGSRSQRRHEADHGWRWTQILGEYRGNAFREAVAIETCAGVIEGAMSYWTNGRSLLDSGSGAVFVHYLATAPRNRPWLVDRPAFRGVGTGLLLYAVCHSYALGLDGRVALVSLPTERTRAFYTSRGFTRVNELEDGIIEFELTPEMASNWLREKALLP